MAKEIFLVGKETAKKTTTKKTMTRKTMTRKNNDQEKQRRKQ